MLAAFVGLCDLSAWYRVGCCGVNSRTVTRNWPVCWPHGRRTSANAQQDRFYLSKGIPPILGTHQLAKPAHVVEVALHPRVAKRRLDCDLFWSKLSQSKALSLYPKTQAHPGHCCLTASMQLLSQLHEHSICHVMPIPIHVSHRLCFFVGVTDRFLKDTYRNASFPLTLIVARPLLLDCRHQEGCIAPPNQAIEMLNWPTTPLLHFILTVPPMRPIVALP